MNFVTERKDLLKAMALATSVIERRNTIPILSNVLIEAKNDILRFTATDLDIQVSIDVKSDVHTPGRITVPGGMFNDIVRKLPDGSQVECEDADPRFNVKSGRSRFHLQSLPADDFPDLAAGDVSTQFVMPAAQLRRLFAKAFFCISTEEARYYLNGIHLHIHMAREFRAVATDGHRLSLVWTDVPEGAKGMPAVIVPRKACQMLIKSLEEVNGDVRVSVTASKIIAEWGGTRLVSKLIDGTFPDYERVIPRNNDKAAVIDAKIMAVAVDRVSTISNEKGRASRYMFDQNKLDVLVSSPDSGTAEDSIDVEYGGPQFEIGFNCRYVLDMLANIGATKIRVEMGDSGMPAIVRPQDGDLQSLAVLMPMRV